jgi:hypothetical protein
VLLSESELNLKQGLIQIEFSPSPGTPEGALILEEDSGGSAGRQPLAPVVLVAREIRGVDVWLVPRARLVARVRFEYRCWHAVTAARKNVARARAGSVKGPWNAAGTLGPGTGMFHARFRPRGTTDNGVYVVLTRIIPLVAVVSRDIRPSHAHHCRRKGCHANYCRT